MVQEERTSKDPVVINTLSSSSKTSSKKKKSGTLKTSRQELEKHLENVHHDTKRHEQIVIPPVISAIQPPEFNLDTSPPKWKEKHDLANNSSIGSEI